MGPVDPDRGSRWRTAARLPDPRTFPAGQDLVGIIPDPDPLTLLAGYRRGLFAMPFAEAALGEEPFDSSAAGTGMYGWYSPDPRGVLPVVRFHVSRSLRRALRRYRVTFDSAFEDVLWTCATLPRPGGWITRDYLNNYLRLRELGHAHSVEVWDGERLTGGLFGIESGGLFAGESMFHIGRDASKVAVAAAVSRLQQAGGQRVFDVQWWTPHLGSLGAIEIPRSDYLRQLDQVADTSPAF